MKWVKNDRLDNISRTIYWNIESSGVDVTKRLCTQQIVQIEVKHYQTSGTRAYAHNLKVLTQSPEIIDQFRPFVVDEKKYVPTTPPSFAFMTNAQGYVVDPNQYEKLSKYCLLIKTYAHFDDETYLDLLKTVGIRSPLEEYKMQITNHLNNDPIDFKQVKKLASKAQEDGYYDVIYETAIKLGGIKIQSKESLDCRLELLQEISKNNPHYKEANEQICNLLTELWKLQLSDMKEEKLLDMNEDEYYYALLFHAQETGEQTLMDRFFYTACGGTGLPSELEIKNVKGEVTFLVSIARQHRKLVKECEELKKRNARLEAGAAALARTNNVLFKEAANNTEVVQEDTRLDYSC